jgi:hypothetical protein
MSTHFALEIIATCWFNRVCGKTGLLSSALVRDSRGPNRIRVDFDVMGGEPCRVIWISE